MSDPRPIPIERIASRILVIRGLRVVLDRDLAVLYGVTTKQLNQQIKRNARKFPDDFMNRRRIAQQAAPRLNVVFQAAIGLFVVIGKRMTGGRALLPNRGQAARINVVVRDELRPWRRWIPRPGEVRGGREALAR